MKADLISMGRSTSMNHFRKVAQVCKEILPPENLGGLDNEEIATSHYAQGRYDLAQEILSILSLASKKTDDF